MAGAEVLRRLTWRICDVVEVIQDTPTVRSLVLDCPGWPGHLPGQHIDVRLTAEDGYQAERSYSIATPWCENRVVLTVERLPDGEVSPYLCDELTVGDQLELRGPIGGYFVWDAQDHRPLLLLGGGTGVVPLMAMIRRRREVADPPPTRLLLSARSFQELIYRHELERLAAEGSGFEFVSTLTRSRPAGWAGYDRRLDREMLQEVAWEPATGAVAFVCGPTGFVENAADALVGLGYDPERILTERFGPTGGPA